MNEADLLILNSVPHDLDLCNNMDLRLDHRKILLRYIHGRNDGSPLPPRSRTHFPVMGPQSMQYRRRRVMYT